MTSDERSVLLRLLKDTCQVFRGVEKEWIMVWTLPFFLRISMHCRVCPPHPFPSLCTKRQTHR